MLIESRYKNMLYELRSRGTQARIDFAKNAYENLEKALKNVIGFEKAWWMRMRLVLLILTADGKLGMDEFRIFKAISDSCCTYDELYASTADINRDMEGAFQDACRYGGAVREQMILLDIGILSLREQLGNGDIALFNSLVRGQ